MQDIKQKQCPGDKPGHFCVWAKRRSLYKLPIMVLLAQRIEHGLAKGCDALVVVADWNEFKHLDLARVRDLMNQPVLVDGRNIYDPATMRELGFYYRGVGRGYQD